MTHNYLQQHKDNILKHHPEPKSLDELAWIVIETINRHQRKERKKILTAKVAGFAWNVTYGNVSNSHQRPISGVENWGNRKEDAPTGYPGWNGRVWIRYEEPYGSFGSDPFAATLTYPGTGGWGGYDGPWQGVSTARFARYRRYKNVPRDAYPEPQIYSWDYKFFASDWPLLEDWVEKQELIKVLANKGWNRSHRFQWEDPVIAAADKIFMEEDKTKKALEEYNTQKTKYGW